MSLTITIPGAVEATIGATAPAVLTIGVGTPGATGPAGPAGVGVPAGGTAGQFLTKIDGTNYNTDWTTVNLSAYAPLASPAFTGNPTAPTATFGDNDTSISTTAFVQAALAGGTAVAKNLEVYVRNQSGSTIAAGSIVYISGATGNRPLITLAQANNDTNSAQTIGFVKTSIANNGFGNVIVRGELENIDTSALTEGAQLYLSPTTAGTWTTTKPSAPQHLVYVGIVLRSHPTQGTILVAVQNGYELGEIHDVKLTSPSNDQVLKFDSAQGLWVNGNSAADYISSVSSPLAVTTGNLTVDLSAYLPVAGGTLDANSTITASTATELAVFSGSGFNVELSANPSENSVLNYNGLQVQNFSGTMAVTPSGLTFPDASTQSTAGLSPATAASTYYLQTNPSGFITSASLSGYAQLSGATFTGEVSTPASTTSSAGLSILPGTAPTSPVNGDIWNTGSDLQVRLGGVTETIAEQSWVSTNYAPKADAALTGNVTITSNSASPALVITQDGTGDVVQFKDVTSDTTYSFINASGKVTTIPAVTASAGFNIPHGTAPTTLVDGDIWTTTGGLFWRQNGTTYQAVNLSATQTISGNITFSNANLVIGSSTATGTVAIGNGATVSGSTKTVNLMTNGATGSTSSMLIGPTAGASTIEIGPSTVGSNLYLAVGATASGSTKTVNIATGAVAGSTSNITIGSSSGGTSTTTLNGTTNFIGPITGAINNITLGNGTAASTYNLFTGATVSGSTKAVAIATGGAAGSTTTVTIGNTTGSTTTLQGTTNGVTAAADTNSVALATTAYVVGQAGSATPIVDGTAAVGTSLRYARQDHVHPTDTTRAPLASPSLTGTPLSTTAAADTNTTQIATTAFVVGQASATSPAALGTATVGTSLKYARADHVHPTAFAATSDVNGPSSTTVTTSPKNVVDMLLHAGYNLFYQGAGSSSTSGAGSAIYGYGGRWKEYVSPNAGTAGYALGVYDTEQVSYGYTAYSRSAAISLHDWTKKIWISGRCMLGHPTISTTYDGDANTFARISLGGYTAFAAGDMSSAQRGIGFKVAGGGAAALQLVVTNGTTVTTVTSSFTPTLRQVFDWKIYSDGAGNVTLFVNDSQVATTAAGPSTTGSFGLYMEGVDTTVSSTRALIMENFGTKIYHGV
jgi:hypothetical protein